METGATAATARRDAGHTAPRGWRRTFTETKAGFKTTEFILTIIAIAGILIAGYIADANLGENDAWRFASWIAVAYIISRGLAKLGSREPYGRGGDEQLA